MSKKKKEKTTTTTTIPEEKTDTNFIFYLLIFATLVGIVIRFVTINFNPLWLDEGSTYIISKMSFGDIWTSMIGGEFNPPLFYWMEHVMLALFGGGSELVLRFIPFVAGVIAIPITYCLGKELYDERAGIIGAILMAVSPWAVVYSQEARVYTLAMALFAVAFVYWIRAMKNVANIKFTTIGNSFSHPNPNAIIFAVMGAITFWLHFYALIFIGILFLISYIYHIYKKDGHELIGWILAGGLFTVIIYPLIIVIKNLIFYRMESSTGTPFGVTGWLVITQTFYQLSGFSWLTAFIIIILVAIGIFIISRQNKMNATSISSILIISFAISIILAPYINMVPRYLCYMLPVWFATIGASYPLFTIGYKTKRENHIIVMGVIVILMLTTIPALNSSLTVPFKNDWRGVTQYLDKNAQEGDVIAIVPGYVHQPLRFYYDEEKHNTPFKLVYNVNDMQTVFDTKEEHTIFYVISNDVGYSSDAQEMARWLESHAKGHERFTAVDVVVVR